MSRKPQLAPGDALQQPQQQGRCQNQQQWILLPKQHQRASQEQQQPSTLPREQQQQQKEQKQVEQPQQQDDDWPFLLQQQQQQKGRDPGGRQQAGGAEEAGTSRCKQQRKEQQEASFWQRPAHQQGSYVGNVRRRPIRMPQHNMRSCFSQCQQEDMHSSLLSGMQVAAGSAGQKQAGQRVPQQQGVLQLQQPEPPHASDHEQVGCYRHQEYLQHEQRQEGHTDHGHELYTTAPRAHAAAAPPPTDTALLPAVEDDFLPSNVQVNVLCRQLQQQDHEALQQEQQQAEQQQRKQQQHIRQEGAAPASDASPGCWLRHTVLPSCGKQLPQQRQQQEFDRPRHQGQHRTLNLQHQRHTGTLQLQPISQQQHNPQHYAYEQQQQCSHQHDISSPSDLPGAAHQQTQQCHSEAPAAACVAALAATPSSKQQQQQLYSQEHSEPLLQGTQQLPTPWLQQQQQQPAVKPHHSRKGQPPEDQLPPGEQQQQHFPPSQEQQHEQQQPAAASKSAQLRHRCSCDSLRTLTEDDLFALETEWNAYV